MQKAMKRKVFVLLAPGFEEIDVCTVTQALRRTGFAVAVIGLTVGPVRGAYGLSLVPDCTLNEAERALPRAVVLPGGVQATRQCNADPRVHRLVRGVAGQGGYVMALDTAYTVVRSAGVLDPHKSRWNGGSGEETVERAVYGWDSEMVVLGAAEELPSERVLVEGPMVFGQDSGAAKEAALTLAALLGERRYSASRGSGAGI